MVIIIVSTLKYLICPELGMQSNFLRVQIFSYHPLLLCFSVFYDQSHLTEGYDVKYCLDHL